MMRKTYDPVGRCIYCGNADVTLTREHIVPLALNGRLVLPKASCDACATITCAFETQVLRGFVHPTRVALGYKSRNPKGMPETFPLGIIRGGVETVVQAPLGNYPTMLPLPIFPLPAFMDIEMLKNQRDYVSGIALTGVQTIWYRDPEKIRQHYKADSISLLIKMDHIAFARMLAKIAYSFAVGQMGLDAIEEAFVLPCIMGESDDIGRWVGGSDQPVSGEPGESYILGLNIFEWPDRDKPRPIVVFLHPFTHSTSMAYFVIVGSARRPDLL